MALTVVVLGRVVRDTTIFPDRGVAIGDGERYADILTGYGGSACNTARWLAAEGVTVAAYFTVGAAHAATITEDFSGFGLDTSPLTVDTANPHWEPESCIIVSSSDGRAIYTDRREGSYLKSDPFPTGLLPADNPSPHHHAALHTDGFALLYWPRQVAAALAHARHSSVVTSLAIGPAVARYLSHHGRGTDNPDSPPLADVLRNVDVLTCNRDEWAMLEAHYGPDCQAILYRTTVLITDGPRPITAVAPYGGPQIQVPVPARAATEVADTTGAGDAFVAGFLSAWLARAHFTAVEGGTPAATLTAAVRAGARLGSWAVTKRVIPTR